MTGIPYHDPIVVFNFISLFIDENGYAPSLREITDGCDLGSTSTANYLVDKLIEMGMVTKVEKIARSIRIVKKSKK